MHEVLVEGDMVKLMKEAPKEDLSEYILKGKPIEVTRYALTSTQRMVCGLFNWRSMAGVNLTVTNIGKACSG